MQSCIVICMDFREPPQQRPNVQHTSVRHLHIFPPLTGMQMGMQWMTG